MPVRARTSRKAATQLDSLRVLALVHPNQVRSSSPLSPTRQFAGLWRSRWWTVVVEQGEMASQMARELEFLDSNLSGEQGMQRV